ncbi:helix-turn-helix transcriptional regulator [Acinetobacter sichuanensis]|uniref:Helix-turn-helix transcriptional regulator n=1 Tax=Acinetobacter sichuanensis TaxID=2136183 RepID=A0A371YIM2_9GAMM|nr:S24 family peptidase [Acinetobacter sichuanensis]RFC81329.1 S24 family peptidase [Acinetobacter sichuanensis]
MDTITLRRKNLRAAISAALEKQGFKSDVAFCEHYDLNPSHVSQLMNGHGSFGERAARNLEKKVGWDEGLLDNPLLFLEKNEDDFKEPTNNDSGIRYAPVRFVEAKNPNNKNHVRIPIYRDVKASCGDGIENFLEDVSDYLEIDPELLKLMGVRSNSKNLKIIYSAEYSMYPTVAPDSPLFVDVSDKDPNNLKNGNVYVFTHNHELRMKRIFVSYGSNTVKLTSDNPDKNRYPDEFITNEQLNEINFIGRLELALIRP